MGNQITKSIIQNATYVGLRKLCPQFNVKFNNQPKEKLIELLIRNSEKQTVKPEIVDITNSIYPEDSKFNTNNKKTITKTKAKPVVKTKRKGLTTSDKIRALFDKGKSITQISHILKAHYSFVHTVVRKYKPLSSTRKK